MKTINRRILSVILAVMMVVSLTTVGYASDGGGGTVAPMGGTETWNKGGGLVGEFYLDGNNLTPVKTIGDSGKLQVYGFADTTNGGNNWAVKVQLINAKTGKVVQEDTTEIAGSNSQSYVMSRNVSKGEQYQIYMYYVHKPATNAKVSIYYILS